MLRFIVKACCCRTPHLCSSLHTAVVSMRGKEERTLKTHLSDVSTHFNSLTSVKLLVHHEWEHPEPEISLCIPLNIQDI